MLAHRVICVYEHDFLTRQSADKKALTASNCWGIHPLGTTDQMDDGPKLRANCLPSEVGECLVSIGHSVCIFSLGDCSTFFSVSSHQLFCELQMCGSTLLVANSTQHPSESQALLTVLVDLHWHLIRCTTNSLRSHFDVRLYVFDRLLENFDRRTILDFLSDFVESGVENSLCRGFLAVVHQAIDELRCEQRVVSWVRSK